MREWRQFDVDGQLRVRERRSPSIGILTRDQLAYDARGKILEAHTFSAATDHIQKRTTMAYSGLGPILASEATDETLYARWELEEFRPDRFGNNYYRKRTTGATGVEEPLVSTFALHSGALTATSAIFDPDDTESEDELARHLDLAGNVLRAGQVKLARVSSGAFRHSQSALVSYYSGDNRLMAMQRYDASVLKDGHPDPITGRGTWEEYRYDALGRRVVTIVRRDHIDLCSPQISPECDTYVERVVWDGDDLLYEHREGGSQYTSGSVGYVQGGVIDQPLAQLNGRILNPNWRGLYESSVLPNGTRADCSLPGSGTCITVAWPAGQGVYYIRFPVSGGGNPSTWIGSLASNGEGSTGLLYRRNRFYDPATGQFTQQDPIGVAGGINHYGYAGGDPVNYGDPFGLSTTVLTGAEARAFFTKLKQRIELQVNGPFGQNALHHASIRITPEDQEKWCSDRRFTRGEDGKCFVTIGAQAVGCSMRHAICLRSDLNRDSDVGPQRERIAFDLTGLD